VDENKQEPVHEPLGFLLLGNHCLLAVDTLRCLTIAESVQQVLGCTTLHIEIDRLHGLQPNRHGPLCCRLLEDVILLEESSASQLSLFFTTELALFERLLSVCASHVTVDYHHGTDKQSSHTHLVGNSACL
jgi:hypothetical protein